MKRWGDKRYYSLDYYLKEVYGEKLYKLSLNGGMTCPNRDGTLDSRGCIFCSAGGSGDFSAPSSIDIREQIAYGKKLVERKYKGHSYIAYFQAYTNTYAPVSHLEKIFTEAIQEPEIKILSIATRPDCLGKDVLDLLAKLNQIKPVWVEKSAEFIRRGYTLDVFESAVKNLRAIGITVIVHTILGLPNETEEMMLETISYLNQLDIQGIKLQLLHILKGTDMAVFFKNDKFYLPSLEEYMVLLSRCISLLRPDIVVHRLTGDGPKDLLIAPLWTGSKRFVLNSIQRYFKSEDIWQGKEYFPQ